MPLMISRIGQARVRPVAQGFGKCGAITRHSASVRSVWYRVTVRLCCCRVVGVHMANLTRSGMRRVATRFETLCQLIKINGFVIFDQEASTVGAVSFGSLLACPAPKLLDQCS